MQPADINGDGIEMTSVRICPTAPIVCSGRPSQWPALLDLVTTMREIDQIQQNPGVIRRTPAPMRPILISGIAQTTALQHQGAVTAVVEYSGDGR